MAAGHSEATNGVSQPKREAKREALPAFQSPSAHRLAALHASAPRVFRRGFSLTVDKRKLYVRTAGTKVPLGLDWEHATDEEVLRQALLLKDHLMAHKGQYKPETWQALLADQQDLPGQPRPAAAGTLEELEQFWWERKQPEGMTRATFEKHYGRFILQLDPRAPLSETSLIKVIGSIAPDSPTRKRLVAFLRELVQARGSEWNAALLDPLQMRAKRVKHRELAFFTDDAIVQIVNDTTNPSWRRVFALLAVYGLRPWEAWAAEPCKRYDRCVWIPRGKKNSKGENPPRSVPPFHPDWHGQFRIAMLWSVPLPGLNEPSYAGQRGNKQQQRYRFCQGQRQESSYGFRHAYARRLHTEQYRITDTRAALHMGHTTATHNAQYRRWIDGQEDAYADYQPRE